MTGGGQRPQLHRKQTGRLRPLRLCTTGNLPGRRPSRLPAECRANLPEIFADYLNLDETDDRHRAASCALAQNIVHGDALTMHTHADQALGFAEWDYLGKGRFRRRNFRGLGK